MTTDKSKLSSHRLKAKMADVLGLDVDRLEDDVVLSNLITSSFLMVETIIEVQEEFGIRFNQEDMKGVETVGDLIALFLKTVEVTG